MKYDGADDKLIIKHVGHRLKPKGQETFRKKAVLLSNERPANKSIRRQHG